MTASLIQFAQIASLFVGLFLVIQTAASELDDAARRREAR